MFDYKKAQKLAKIWVELSSDDAAALQLDRTLTKPYGWVFFYESKKFIESGNKYERFWGNAPILIDRFAGEIVIFGTAKPVESYISDYEKKLPKARLKISPAFPPKNL